MDDELTDRLRAAHLGRPEGISPTPRTRIAAAITELGEYDARLDNIQRRIALLRQCLQATVEGDHDRADALLEAMDRPDDDEQGS